MPWYEMLGFGIVGGLVCGGLFFALGYWLDYRQARQWRRELDLPPLPVRTPRKFKTEETDPDGA